MRATILAEEQRLIPTLLPQLRPCAGAHGRLSEAFNTLQVFEDYKSRSRSHFVSDPRHKNLEEGLYYVEWPYKVRLGGVSVPSFGSEEFDEEPRLQFLTRWLNWHPQWDTWEPFEHFFEGETTETAANYNYYVNRLDILTCRFLLAYAFLGALEEAAVRERPDAPSSCGKLMQLSQPWVQRLTGLVRDVLPRLLPRLQELMLPVNWLSAPIYSRIDVMDYGTQLRAAVTLPPLRVWQKTLFSIAQGPFVPGDCGEELLWHRAWQKAADAVLRAQLSGSSGGPKIKRYALIDSLKRVLSPEVRLPRRAATVDPRDPLALWLWRSHAGSATLHPFVYTRTRSFYEEWANPHAFCVSGMKLTLCGLYSAPLVIDNPANLCQLWLPPWIKDSKYTKLAPYGRGLLPCYSTPVSHVPSEIVDEVSVLLSRSLPESSKEKSSSSDVGSETSSASACFIEDVAAFSSQTSSKDALLHQKVTRQKIYFVNFKSNYGRSCPPRCWLSSQVIESLYPHLLVDWTILKSLRRLRAAVPLGVSLLVPRILTRHAEGPALTPLRRLRDFIRTSSNQHLRDLRIECATDYLGDVDCESRGVSDLSMCRWDLLRMEGTAGEVCEALLLLFDFSGTLALDNDPEKALKLSVFVHLPQTYRRLYEGEDAGVIAHLLTCGFHSPRDRPQLAFAFPDLPEVGESECPVVLEHAILFDPHTADRRVGLTWPLFISESPRHVGHILACLFGDIAARLLRATNETALLAEALPSSVPLYHGFAAVDDSKGASFGPADRPEVQIPTPGVLRSLISSEKHLWTLGEKLEEMATLATEEQRESSLTFTRSQQIWTRDFDVAFRAAMIAFGGPSPLWTATYIPVKANVTTLGLMEFVVTPLDPSNVPWTVTHKDLYGGDIEANDDWDASSEESVSEGDRSPPSAERLAYGETAAKKSPSRHDATSRVQSQQNAEEQFVRRCRQALKITQSEHSPKAEARLQVHW